MTEFNLKEQRELLFNEKMLPLNEYDKKTMLSIKGFVEMQDKEFIQVLKEEIKTKTIEKNKSRSMHFKELTSYEVDEIIDKLGGYN